MRAPDRHASDTDPKSRAVDKDEIDRLRKRFMKLDKVCSPEMIDMQSGLSDTGLS